MHHYQIEIGLYAKYAKTKALISLEAHNEQEEKERIQIFKQLCVLAN